MQPIQAPRVSLAHLPTPLQPMTRLRAVLGCAPALFVKRDDCTGLALGGNKTRKLEFTLGAALAAGADTLVTTGGLQSNHVRQTAAAAARCGLACHAMVASPLPRPDSIYRSSGNLLLDGLFGAVLHEAADDAVATARAAALVESLRRDGRRPFLVPLGASDGLGSLGYVVCAEELLAQCREQGVAATHVVLCTGSAGTHGGLLAGLRRAGSAISVIGVSSSEPSAVKIGKVRSVMGQVFETLGEAPPPNLDAGIDVRDDYVGEGYAFPTDEANRAIRLAAETEALVLDPVYTGKAMAGLIDLLAKGEFADDAQVVFLHTGGAPALFAYPHLFPPAWDATRQRPGA